MGKHPKGILEFQETRFKLVCRECGREYPPDPRLFRCPHCGSLLYVEPEDAKVDWSVIRGRRPGVWRYKEMLPLPRGVEPVSLGEGGTPLIELDRISAEMGLGKLYLKFEGANPTGSFKDRGMSVAVTIARSIGAGALLAASTGNTAASAAAYAARAGLRSIVVLPEGKVSLGKLTQAVLHGAVILSIQGSFDNALESVMRASEEGCLAYPVNSFNPWRLEGQKTIAFEIYDALGRVPDIVVVPVGNAGNISAIWKGFKELVDHGVTKRTPRMIGVQAEGASPLASAWRRGLNTPIFTDRPETVATAIRIGRPVNWAKALRAVRESGGTFISVADDEILDAQKQLARMEGIGVEPASAAPLAGLRRLKEESLISRDDLVVLIATGHALKDPQIASSHKAEIIRADNAEEAARIIRKIALRERS